MLRWLVMMGGVMSLLGCGGPSDPKGGQQQLTAGEACQQDRDCVPGLVCRDNVCAEPDPPPPACRADGDCPAGQICRDNQCVPGNPPPQCSTDADCPTRQVCRDHQCVPADPPPRCNGNADCPSGQLCRDNECIPDPGCGHPQCPPPPPQCNVFDQSCRDVEMCVLDRQGDAVCIPAGGEGEGSQCTRAGICRRGLACVAPSPRGGVTVDPVVLDNGGTCRSFCDAQHACQGATVCVPIVEASGIGVCATP
jgi:Cys-rich repeat protein